MIERKETRQYTLTVEGETEKMYFEWLQKEINTSENAKYKVKIIPKVFPYPLEYIKRLNAKSTPVVFHICDIESKSAEDIKKFHNVLSQLKEAKEQKHIEYGLGYSNLTFELWMILHKKDCNAPFSDRSQYLAPINSAYNEKFNSLKSYKEERNFKQCLSKLSLSDVNDAVKRAKNITQNNREIGNPQKSYKGFKYYQDNPSLSIWEIVEEILTECIQ